MKATLKFFSDWAETLTGDLVQAGNGLREGQY
jgi:hypothetical protein